MSNREIFDWSMFTDAIESIDVFGFSLRKSLAGDVYAGKTRFKARALTDMFPLSSNEVMALDGGATGNDGSTRWAFKGRIIGDDSPHSFLPNPCEPGFLANTSETYRIIAMHTTFISLSADSGENVTRGDIVVVEVDRSDHSYNLEYGRFITISAHEEPSPTQEAACASLIGLMGKWGGPPATGTGFATTHVPTGDGSERTINFNSIKHALVATCQPADASAKDVEAYFGTVLWEKYKKVLGDRESGGKYSETNKWHYMGKWQFGVEALKDYGVIKDITSLGACKSQSSSCKSKVGAFVDDNSNWNSGRGAGSKAEWLANKGGVQDKAMKSYTNARFLWLKKRNLIDLSNPKDVAGMIAASHLIGLTRAQRMRSAGKEKGDALGTYPSDYYTLLGNIC